MSILGDLKPPFDCDRDYGIADSAQYTIPIERIREILNAIPALEQRPE